MPGRILRLSPPDIHGVLRVTVEEEHFSGNTRRTYRVSEAAYESLGAPAARTEIDDETLAALGEAEGAIRARAKAESLLSYGDNSANGLCRKLRRHGYTKEQAEGAVAAMIGKGYIREEEQAYRMAVLCATQKLYGPRRIIAALSQKGYSVATARAAIAAAEESGDIDFAASKETLLAKKFGDAKPTYAEKRKVLYTYGY